MVLQISATISSRVSSLRREIDCDAKRLSLGTASATIFRSESLPLSPPPLSSAPYYHHQPDSREGRGTLYPGTKMRAIRGPPRGPWLYNPFAADVSLKENEAASVASL